MLAAPIGYVDGRLGRTIQILELGVGEPLQRLIPDLGRESLPAADQEPDFVALLRFLEVEEDLQHGRHKVEGSHTLRSNCLNQSSRIPVHARARQAPTVLQS